MRGKRAKELRRLAREHTKGKPAGHTEWLYKQFKAMYKFNSGIGKNMYLQALRQLKLKRAKSI